MTENCRDCMGCNICPKFDYYEAGFIGFDYSTHDNDAQFRKDVETDKVHRLSVPIVVNGERTLFSLFSPKIEAMYPFLFNYCVQNNFGEPTRKDLREWCSKAKLSDLWW